MKFRHLFIPHTETHQKAHLVSWHGLLIYTLIFMLMQVSFSIFAQAKPGVLGVDSSIDYKKVIELTNQEREKAGLPPLSENLSLDNAATNKGTNMFAENYWAHFAPSGKTPWDFITASGYKFSSAGENLAKNFYTSEDVVKAWMDSPSHKKNILNPKYKDIGIAVVDGVLNGQKTTLVVQEFGTSSLLAEVPTVSVGGQQISVPQTEQPQLSQIQPLVASANIEKTPKAMVDPYQVYKTFGIGILTLVGILLVVDFVVLRRRGVFRFSSHYLASISFIAVGIAALIIIHPGVII
ncbi:MAG: CAP domain-containing protein [Candidatus Daviesbacteria bacterium]|nr:CAP domain-containing protein [Candidatus Daviesbacteria bacterium]